jgi:hypothetical protein
MVWHASVSLFNNNNDEKGRATKTKNDLIVNQPSDCNRFRGVISP